MVDKVKVHCDACQNYVPKEDECHILKINSHLVYETTDRHHIYDASEKNRNGDCSDYKLDVVGETPDKRMRKENKRWF